MVGQVSYIVGAGGDTHISTRAGPGRAVNSAGTVAGGNIAVFSDSTGSVIQDSGVPLPGGGSYGVATADINGMATLNTFLGRVTTQPLTVGPGGIYTLMLDNNLIDSTSIVLASVAQGTNTTEGIVVTRVSPGDGVVDVVILNLNFSTAWNGSLIIGFEVVNNLPYGATHAVTGAATLNTLSGRITTEPLTTGPGGIYALALTNVQLAADSLVFATVEQGTNTTEGIVVTRVTSGVGYAVIVIQNLNFSTAWNGTLVIGFEVR